MSRANKAKPQRDPLDGVRTIGELERLAGVSRDGVFSESFHFWSSLDAELRGLFPVTDGHQLLTVGGQRLRGQIMARVQQGDLCLIGEAA